LKYNKLVEIVRIADRMDFPIQIGTEMNMAGLPFADDLKGKYLNTKKINVFFAIAGELPGVDKAIAIKLRNAGKNNLLILFRMP
jgi:hypothetical protein